MRIRIRASYDSFRELRENGAYYVDKTQMIEDYLQTWFDKAVLFARPRRFGKTLTMTMLRDFLDIRQESAALFEGLKIMEYPDTVCSYMNQYPVVFLSLKEVYGRDFKEIFRNFQNVISTVCKGYSDLLESERVNSADKVLFKQLMFRDGRSDLVILDPAKSRCLILELKHVKQEKEMAGALREAASKIEEKKYESRLLYQGYETRLKYALAFWEKRAALEKLV